MIIYALLKDCAYERIATVLNVFSLYMFLYFLSAPLQQAMCVLIVHVHIVCCSSLF